MSKSDLYYTEKTIASWDEAASIHETINSSLPHDVKNKRFNSLNGDFNALIDKYNVHGKSVVQVCCNNGIDLLSIKNKGAARCLGIDGSHQFIEQAKHLAESACQADVEFHCSDIYQLSNEYLCSFDYVVVSVGVLNWMPNLEKFLRVCSSLLLPNGVLLIEDIHPILSMYEEGKPSYINSSYFSKAPYKDTDGLDYFTGEKYDAKENYWFNHSLSDILMCAISNDLQLEHVKELNYNIGNYCADLEFISNNPPLGINLAWRKNA